MHLCISDVRVKIIYQYKHTHAPFRLAADMKRIGIIRKKAHSMIEEKCSAYQKGENVAMNIEKGRMIKSIAVGTVIAYLTSTVLLLIFAFVLLKMQLGTGAVEILILITYGLSALTGGWYAGRKGAKRKFLLGMLVGLVYFLLLFAVSDMAEGQVQPEISSSLAALGLCLAGGMLGGMIS